MNSIHHDLALKSSTEGSWPQKDDYNVQTTPVPGIEAHAAKTGFVRSGNQIFLHTCVTALDFFSK